jgi:hypothetical protein
MSLVIALFGALSAAAGLLLSGQALGRSIRAGRHDRRVLAVFGARRRDVIAASLLLPVVSIVAGLVCAMVAAIAASPAMPLGPVRRVDPARGVDADWFVLLGGSAVVLGCLVAWSLVATWRDLRSTAAAARAPAIRSPRLALASGLRPEAGVGLRFALSVERGVPVSRSAIFSSVTAVAAVIAALVFSASLTDLVRTPASFGWDFDAALIKGNGYDNLDASKAADILGSDDGVETWTGVFFGADSSGDVDVPLLGMQPDSQVRPPILSGRFISREGEAVLGRATADELGLDIGDELVLDGTGATHALRVVGIGVLPTIGKTHAQRTSLGRGAVVTPGVVPGFDLDMLGNRHDEPLGPNAMFVEYRPGADRSAVTARLRQSTQVLSGFAGLDLLEVQRPAEVVVADGLGAAPMLLAGGLALGAIGSLLVALGASVRRHRDELAVLTALGFTGRQRAATVMWQSTTVVVVGLFVGLPLGAVLGRQLWHAFADRVHVAAPPDAPWVAGAFVAVVAVVAANVMALAPARSATRIDVCGALRNERQ